MPSGEALQAETMYKVDMGVQSFPELNIQTLCCGCFAQRRVQGPLQADVIPLD